MLGEKIREEKNSLKSNLPLENSQIGLSISDTLCNQIVEHETFRYILIIIKKAIKLKISLRFFFRHKLSRPNLIWSFEE